MNKHAVFITVLFSLGIAIVSVSAVFWEFYKLNRYQYTENIFSKHETITQIYREHLQKKTSKIMLEANLAVYKFIIEKNSSDKKIILQNATILKQKNFKRIDEAIMLNKQGLYTKKFVRDARISMIDFQNQVYFYIQTPIGSILIHDEELKPYKYYSMAYSYLTIIFIITASFILILQKLRPLTRLRKKIALYGEGNMDISFKTNGSDEIALVSNEIESARENINSVLEARTLFLRNLMHELKTPIAKGTIATQMLGSQKQRDRFSSIFGRLESLVNEFALIEEVTSINDKTDFNEYRLVDMIDGAIDMAMVEADSISVDVDANIKLNANYRLYTTAIKNMIDNGIKYSPDSQVNILILNDELCFESKGECIANPLNYYIEPFTKDNPSKNSFGLGLYLVDSILKAHSQILAHEYDSDTNRFIFA